MRDLPAQRPAPFIIAAQFVVFAVALVFPLLIDLGYRLFDAEVVLISGIAAFTVLPLVFASIRWALVRRVSFALLICWFLDLYFIEFKSEVFEWFVLAIVGLSLLPFENNLRNFSALFVGCFVMLSAVSPLKSIITPPLSEGIRATQASNSKLPLVVHLILDEQGSPLAASPALIASGALDRLIAEYIERGFVAHSWVRARSGATDRSLSALFAPPGADEGDNWAKSEGDFNYMLRRNYHVENLQKRGFEVSVLQSSYFQLCPDQRVRCHTYPLGTYGHSMVRFDGALGDRLLLAVMEMHSEQYSTESERYVHFYKPIGDWLVIHGVLPHKRQFWTTSSMMLDVLDELGHRASTMRPGEAYLIHLLAPHYPYVLDASCNLRDAQYWSVPDWAAEVFGQSESKLETAYWEQAKCLHSRLLALIDTIDRVVGREKSVIVLHGDHGSRLFHRMAHPHLNVLDAQGPIGSLDTLLLVRAPGVKAAINSELIPLDELLWRTLATHSLRDQ